MATRAQAEATQAAYRAGPWAFGSAVRTQAEALVAARWAFLEASKEAKEGDRFGPTYYRSIADSAALDYAGRDPAAVLASVAARLSGLPYTAGRWATVRGVSSLAAAMSTTPAPTAAVTRRAAASTALVQSGDAPAPGVLGRMGSWFASLPWWAMPAGAAALLGGIILYVRRPRASA